MRGSCNNLQQGLFFDRDQFLAADGGFEGDGPVRCSYKNPGNDELKKTFNNAFREVRAGIETAFNRLVTWFPLLGVNKNKWNYSDITFQYAVHAAARLHNWLMDIDSLSYDAEANPSNYFRHFY